MSQSGNLDTIGVQAVVQGFEEYVRNLQTVQDKTDQTAASLQRSGDAASESGKGFEFSGGEVLKYAGIIAGAAIGVEQLVSTIREATIASMEYDRELAVLQGQAGLNDAQSQQLRLTIQQLSEAHGQSRSEIAQTATALITQTRVSADNQQKLQELTGQYLDFAEVVGGSAAQAVTSQAEVLKAWQQPAERAISLTDQLLVSHQKFGSDIPAVTAELQTLAPTLQVLGLSLDDAIGFLNGATKAGVDAGSMSLGLSTALRKLTDDTYTGQQGMEKIATAMGMTTAATTSFLALQPAEKFAEISKWIGTTSNANAAAQVSFDLFSSRSGPKFVQMLKEMQGGWQSLTPSALDAADAVKKAGGAVEETDFEKSKRALKGMSTFLGDWGAQIFGGIVTGTIDFLKEIDIAIAEFLKELVNGVNEASRPLDWFIDKISGGKLGIPEMNTSGIDAFINDLQNLDQKLYGTQVNLANTAAMMGPVAAYSADDPNFFPGGSPKPATAAPFVYQPNPAGGGGSSAAPAGGGGSSAAPAETALEAFLKALDAQANLDAMVKTYGASGGAAIAALIDAMTTKVASDGTKALSAIKTLIDDGAKVGLTDAATKGEEIGALFATAMATGLASDQAAAQAAVAAYVAEMDAVKAATADALVAINDIATRAESNETQHGSALTAALVNAIETGTPEAVAAYKRELSAFQVAADASGVKTGDAFVASLQAALDAGTPIAVAGAVATISGADKGFTQQQQTATGVNTIGGDIVNALRARYQEEETAQLAAITQQETDLRDQTSVFLRELQARETATLRGIATEEQAVRDQTTADLRALQTTETATLRSIADETQAVRDQATAAIDAYKGEEQAKLDSIATETQAVKDQTTAVEAEYKAQYEAATKSIDDATAATVAGLNAQKAALNQKGVDTQYADLQFQLGLAYDPIKRKQIQDQIAALDRQQSIAKIDAQIKDVAASATVQKQGLTEAYNADVQAANVARDAKLLVLTQETKDVTAAYNDQVSAANVARDAKIRDLAQEQQATQDAYAAAVQGANDARDAKLKILGQEKQDVTDAYNAQVQKTNDAQAANLKILQQAATDAQKTFADETQAYKLEAEARTLIETGHQDDIIKLLDSYAPGWRTAGKTLAEQLQTGMDPALTAIEQRLGGLLAMLSKLGGGGSGGASGGGATTTNSPAPAAPIASGAGGQFTGTEFAGKTAQQIADALGIPVSMITSGGGVGQFMGVGSTSGVGAPVVASGQKASIHIDLSGSSFMGSPQENADAIQTTILDGAFASGVRLP